MASMLTPDGVQIAGTLDTKPLSSRVEKPPTTTLASALAAVTKSSPSCE